MEYTPLTFQNDKFSYINPSWPDLNKLAFLIAKQIHEARGQNPAANFDRIVTLAKGGWPMTRSLVDYLQVGKVASIGVKFYSGINERLEKPEIYQDLPISVAGEHVLLFDDVADTGESLHFVQQHLMDQGVASCQTATLFYKPHSIIKPDYFGSTTSSWIVFPYDVVEAINVLGGRWIKEGVAHSEILARFTSLGFDLEVVEYYSKNNSKKIS